MAGNSGFGMKRLPGVGMPSLGFGESSTSPIQFERDDSELSIKTPIQEDGMGQETEAQGQTRVTMRRRKVSGRPRR